MPHWRQGDALFAGNPVDWMKLLLTYLVPYCVDLWRRVVPPGSRAAVEPLTRPRADRQIAEAPTALRAAAGS